MPDQKRPFVPTLVSESSISTLNSSKSFKKYDDGLGSPIQALKSARSFSKYEDSPTYSEKSITTPSTAHSYHAKPWPTRPQVLYKGLEGRGWWHTSIDVLMLLAPFPFFILAAAVIYVDGKVVDGHQLDLLQQSIKGVCTLRCYFYVIG